MKIPFRKCKIQFGSISKQTDNLPWKQLEHGKCSHANELSRSHTQKNHLFHTIILLCAIVKAGNRLHALSDSDTESEKDKTYFIDNSGAGQRNGFPIDGQGSIVFQGIIHDNLHHHHRHLIKTLSHPQTHGITCIG